MAITPKPKPPRPTDWLPIYTAWAQGRTGLTVDQMVDAFADIFNLTDIEREKLRKQAHEQPKPPPPPTPPAPPTPEPKQPIPKELIITRTPYPKWWKDLRVAPISFIGPGTQAIVAGSSNYNLYIATIVLTVSGETDLFFGFGVFGATGALDLGGDNEPRGMVIAMADSPAPCGTGGFNIGSSGAAITVGGFVTYYLEAVKT